MGHIFGIKVQVHWSALLVAFMLGISLSGQDNGVHPVVIVVAVVAFMASILAHELGHALTARRFGVPTQSIQLWALGGIARLDREAPTPMAEGLIAFAGPFVSLAVTVAAFAGRYVLVATDAAASIADVLLWLAVLNGFIAIFNLLPGAPLDGGRIVKAFRWARTGNRYRAARDAARMGTVLAALMAFAGVMLMFNGQNGIWILLTAVFIWFNAQGEIVGANFAEELDGVTVGDVMWYGVATAAENMDADELLWQRGRLGAAGGVSVTDGDGHPIGLVLEQELWAIPSERRPMVLLRQMMVPFDGTTRVSASDELYSVLRHVNLRRPMVTVWDGDNLVGMVPPKRLFERLKLLSA